MNKCSSKLPSIKKQAYQDKFHRECHGLYSYTGFEITPCATCSCIHGPYKCDCCTANEKYCVSREHCKKIHLLYDLAKCKYNKNVHILQKGRHHKPYDEYSELYELICFMNIDIHIKDLVVLLTGNYLYFLIDENGLDPYYDEIDIKERKWNRFTSIASRNIHECKKYYPVDLDSSDRADADILLDVYFNKMKPLISSYTEKQLLIFKRLIDFYYNSSVKVLVDNKEEFFNSWKEYHDFIFQSESKNRPISKRIIQEFIANEKNKKDTCHASINDVYYLLNFIETKYFIYSDLEYIGTNYVSYDNKSRKRLITPLKEIKEITEYKK